MTKNVTAIVEILKQTIGFRILPDSELHTIAAHSGTEFIEIDQGETVMVKDQFPDPNGQVFVCFPSPPQTAPYPNPQENNGQNSPAISGGAFYIVVNRKDPNGLDVDLPLQVFEPFQVRQPDGSQPQWINALVGDLETKNMKRLNTVVVARKGTYLRVAADVEELILKYPAFRSEVDGYDNLHHFNPGKPSHSVRPECVIAAYLLGIYKRQGQVLGRIDRKWLSEVSGIPASSISQLLRDMAGDLGILVSERRGSFLLLNSNVTKLEEIYSGKRVLKITRPNIRGSASQLTVVLVLPGLAMLFPKFADALENELGPSWRLVVYSGSRNAFKEENELYMATTTPGVKAIVICAATRKATDRTIELIKDAIEKQILVMEFDRIHENLREMKVPRFVVDNKAAGRLAYDYLRKKGCRSLIGVMEDEDILPGDLRKQGFEEAGAADKTPDKPHLTIEKIQQWGRQGGYELGRLLRQQGLRYSFPIGFFGVNDFTILGLIEGLLDYRTARETLKSLPPLEYCLEDVLHDLSESGLHFCGVDGLTPGLPSVVQDFAELAFRVKKYITDGSNEPSEDPVPVFLNNKWNLKADTPQDLIHALINRIKNSRDS